MIGYIYKITNTVNGKCYIGKTYLDVSERFKQHLAESNKDRCKNRPLYKAISYYGRDKFYYDIIGCWEEGILEDKEVEFIREYDTFKSGYNATLGGDGRRYLTVDDETVISEYKKLKTIKNVSVHLGICSDTVSAILSNNNIDIVKFPNIKKVMIPELNLSFISTRECAKFLIRNSYTKSVNVENVIRGINRTINGDRVKYLGLRII